MHTKQEFECLTVTYSIYVFHIMRAGIRTASYINEQWFRRERNIIVTAKSTGPESRMLSEFKDKLAISQDEKLV